MLSIEWLAQPRIWANDGTNLFLIWRKDSSQQAVLLRDSTESIPQQPGFKRMLF